MTDSFDAAILTRFIADAMVAVGMPAADAADVGRLMVAADLAGFDGHGIFRLDSYLGRITAGGLNLTPKITIATQSPATAVVDGDDGMGHLVVEYATHLAIDKARQNGIGWVGTRNSNHAGAASVYAAMPAEHGMIGLYGAVGSGNNLPPWGGLDPKLATNPIAVAIPSANGPPVVIDFATTVASMGKIKTTAQRGEQMPEGWVVARDGTPMTDPNRASEGLLLPIGGYKGYALGLVIGLLAGTLNGAAMGDAVVDMTGKPGEITNTGQFICAIDPGVFGDAGAIASQVARVAGEIRGSAVMPGHDGVRVPGDGRAARMTERARNGVPIPDGLCTILDRLAGELSIDPLAARTT
jgi:LDH2 family malate/lactate/ureidoglycolate dehydrogenase